MENTEKKSRFADPARWVLSILLIAAVCLLLHSAVGLKRDSPDISNIVYLRSAEISVDGGAWEQTELPCTFRDLKPGTPVTLRATVTPHAYEGIYIKTIHAPAAVYLDGRQVFVFGKPENYPAFMEDPATEIHVVEAFGDGSPQELRIEYLSPETDSRLILEMPMVGTSKELILERSTKFGTACMFALSQIIGGLALLIISLFIQLGERKGALFSWLGLFALTTGLWFFGSNNFAITVFPVSALLYLTGLSGYILGLLPLLHFIRSGVDFENPRPLAVLEKVTAVLALLALAAQLLGLVPLHRSRIFFALLLTPALLLITGLLILEYVRTRSPHAGRLILPMAILVCSEIGGSIQVVSGKTPAFPMFQLGVLIFLLILGIITGLRVRDSIDLQKREKELAWEKKLLQIQTADQKESRLRLADHERMLSQQRHDLRHHLAVIQELSGDNPGLQEYLSTLMEKIPSAKERFCENSVVNAVISHYAGLCEAQGIRFSSALSVPETGSQATDSDLCVIFANLLENGTEACSRMKSGERYLKIRSAMQYELLTLCMENSFSGQLRKSEDRFRSSKREDFGIGLASVRSIAESRGGGCRFEGENGVFTSSVYLSIQ